MTAGVFRGPHSRAACSHLLRFATDRASYAAALTDGIGAPLGGSWWTRKFLSPRRPSSMFVLRRDVVLLVLLLGRLLALLLRRRLVDKMPRSSTNPPSCSSTTPTTSPRRSKVRPLLASAPSSYFKARKFLVGHVDYYILVVPLFTTLRKATSRRTPFLREIYYRRRRASSSPGRGHKPQAPSCPARRPGLLPLCIFRSAVRALFTLHQVLAVWRVLASGVRAVLAPGVVRAQGSSRRVVVVRRRGGFPVRFAPWGRLFFGLFRAIPALGVALGVAARVVIGPIPRVRLGPRRWGVVTAPGVGVGAPCVGAMLADCAWETFSAERTKPTDWLF